MEEANDSCADGIDAEFANDDANIGTVTIDLGNDRPGANEFGFVILRGVRADVSGLAAGDTIVASINSSTAPTNFVPIGQDRTESVGGSVSTVKGGLTVTIEQASRLLCNLEDVVTTDADNVETTTPVGGVPSITVSEGFPTAWEHTGPGPLGAGNDAIGQTDIGQTMIAVKMLNLPKGVTLRWPNQVIFEADP